MAHVAADLSEKEDGREYFQAQSSPLRSRSLHCGRVSVFVQLYLRRSLVKAIHILRLGSPLCFVLGTAGWGPLSREA